MRPFDRAGNSSSKEVIWTGSTNAGVAHGSNPLGDTTVEVGGIRSGFRPLSGGTAHRSSLVPLYAISQVLMVPEQVTREPSPSGGHAPTSRPRQGDTYRLGETFIFPFTFTEPVVVRGVPTMPLELDSGTVRARYHSGSGTNTLLFAYTVQAGDYEESRSGALSGAHLIFAPGDSYMALDGASVRALADGSPALLVSAAAWSTAYGSSHKMEARPAFAKSASISSSPERGTTYGTGETITARLAMSEAVRVTGRPSIRLDVGGARPRADYTGLIGTATDVLEFSYVVQSGDFDADGVTLCASGPGCGPIRLNGGRIRMVSRDVDANLVLPVLAAQRRHRVNAAEPLPTPAPACSAEIRVPSNWALKPSGVDAGGKFRLLFVSSARRDAQSTNIADYNSFVQARARVGHAAIRRYDKGFRVLGSTQTVNARANTCTQSSDTDAAVYWLNGAKAADDYADFYDGSWDSERGLVREREPRTPDGITRTWTGTDNNGTTDAFNPLGELPSCVRGACPATDCHASENRPYVPAVSAIASTACPRCSWCRMRTAPRRRPPGFPSFPPRRSGTATVSARPSMSR